MRERKNKEKPKIKRREKLLGRKEPVLDDSGGSWPIQIAKDAKIRKFTVRKAKGMHLDFC